MKSSFIFVTFLLFALCQLCSLDKNASAVDYSENIDTTISPQSESVSYLIKSSNDSKDEPSKTDSDPQLTSDGIDEKIDISDEEKKGFQFFASRNEPNNEPKKEDDEEEEEEEEEEENTCGSLSSIVRNVNISGLLPDDYYEVSENMWKEDLYAPVKDFNSTLEMMDRFKAYGEKVQSNKDAKDALAFLGSVISDRLFEAKLSSNCMADAFRVVNGIKNFELWAMRMPDAWADTMPSGLLSGHMSSFGEFDQCIKIKSPPIPQEDGLPDRHVYGRYCTAHMHIRTPKMKDYNPDWENVFKSLPIYEMMQKIMKDYKILPFNIQHVRLLIEGLTTLQNNVYHYGLCVPNTCTPDDVQRMLNAFIYPITKIPIAVDETLCDDHADIRKVEFDGFQWFSVYILTFLTILVILSTSYHLYLKYFVDNPRRQLLPSFNENVTEHINYTNDIDNGNTNGNINNNNNIDDPQQNGDPKEMIKNPPLPITEKKIRRTIRQQFLLSFSFIDSTENLFRLQHRLAIVDTLRLLLTIGVFAIQAFNFSTMMTLQMFRNHVGSMPMQMLDDNRLWVARIPGTYIDGFIFTLGLTLYMSQSSRLRKSNGQFSYVNYMVKRWFRLSAAMLGTFVFFYLYVLTGDGPMWFVNERWILPPCKKFSSIVSSFLFYSNWNAAINDYKPSSTFPICNPPTWFLSASTQIYAVLPLVFVPMYKWPKIGMTFLLLLTICSPLMVSAPTWLLGHSNYFDLTDIQNSAYLIRKFLNYHVSPFQYSTSVCIGLITGWILKNKPKFRFPGGRVTELILWPLSFLTIFGCISTNNYLWTMEYVRPRWMTLTWILTTKFLFPLSLAYIIFMCASGRAKTMNRLLSVKTLQPLAKLSFSIYLLRVPIIFHRYTSVRYTYGHYYWQAWQNLFMDFAITAFFAFFLYILFEAPSIKIIQIFESDQMSNYLDAKPKPEKEPKLSNGNGSLPENKEKSMELPTQEYYGSVKL